MKSSYTCPGHCIQWQFMRPNFDCMCRAIRWSAAENKGTNSGHIRRRFSITSEYEIFARDKYFCSKVREEEILIEDSSMIEQKCSFICDVWTKKWADERNILHYDEMSVDHMESFFFSFVGSISQIDLNVRGNRLRKRMRTKREHTKPSCCFISINLRMINRMRVIRFSSVLSGTCSFR